MVCSAYKLRDSALPSAENCCPNNCFPLPWQYSLIHQQHFDQSPPLRTGVLDGCSARPSVCDGVTCVTQPYVASTVKEVESVDELYAHGVSSCEAMRGPDSIVRDKATQTANFTNSTADYCDCQQCSKSLSPPTYSIRAPDSPSLPLT